MPKYKKLFVFEASLLFFFTINLYAKNINNNYIIPITPPKQQKVNICLLVRQYVYDLKKFNSILKKLYHDNNFRFVSQTAELKIKNTKSYYTVDYIENLLKVLNGVDPYDDFHILKNQGYIRYISDIYSDNYKMYEAKCPQSLINNNFDYIEKVINQNLKLLSKNFAEEKDLKPYLRNIFYYLIYVTKQIDEETLQLIKLGVIKPFDKYIDYKYNMPSNWAQYGATFTDILNFMLYGFHSKGYLGIEDYFNKFYFNDIEKFIIIR
jgi:hypothetical protein